MCIGNWKKLKRERRGIGRLEGTGNLGLGFGNSVAFLLKAFITIGVFVFKVAKEVGRLWADVELSEIESKRNATPVLALLFLPYPMRDCVPMLSLLFNSIFWRLLSDWPLGD